MVSRSCIAFSILCAGLVSVGAAQQPASRPKKVLTPEQKAYQQQSQQWSASRQKLQAQGKQVFSDEMAREKAGDCPNATSTVDFETCYGKVLDAANDSLQSYEQILRALMAPPPQMPGQETNMPGPAGPSLTPDQHLAEFEQVEQRWRDYRKAACTAAFHQFDGGTGGGPFEQQCEIQLTRNHLRELHLVYGMDLQM